MSSNNSIADGPIPFFTNDNKQESFLISSNEKPITTNLEQNTLQNYNQYQTNNYNNTSSTSTSTINTNNNNLRNNNEKINNNATNNNQQHQDASILFGSGGKEESFLSTFQTDITNPLTNNDLSMSNSFQTQQYNTQNNFYSIQGDKNNSTTSLSSNYSQNTNLNNQSPEIYQSQGQNYNAMNTKINDNYLSTNSNISSNNFLPSTYNNVGNRSNSDLTNTSFTQNTTNNTPYINTLNTSYSTGNDNILNNPSNQMNYSIDSSGNFIQMKNSNSFYNSQEFNPTTTNSIVDNRNSNNNNNNNTTNDSNSINYSNPNQNSSNTASITTPTTPTAPNVTAMAASTTNSYATSGGAVYNSNNNVQGSYYGNSNTQSAQTTATTAATGNSGYTNPQSDNSAIYTNSSQVGYSSMPQTTANTGYPNIPQPTTTATATTTTTTVTTIPTTAPAAATTNTTTGYTNISQAPTPSTTTTGYTNVSQTPPHLTAGYSNNNTSNNNNPQPYIQYSTGNQYNSTSSYDGINNYSSTIQSKVLPEEKNLYKSPNQAPSQLNPNDISTTNTLTTSTTANSIPSITDNQTNYSPHNNFQEIDPNTIHNYQNLGNNYSNSSSITNTQVTYDNSDLDDLVLGSNESKENLSYYQPQQQTQQQQQQQQINNNNNNSFTNFPNNSAPQINYYSKNENSTYNPATNVTATTSTTPLINSYQQYSTNPSSISTSSSNQNINSTIPNITNNTYATTTTTTTTTNGASYVDSNTNNTNQFSSIYLKQNKNAQNFYSNAATSNSSPCLNSMIKPLSTDTSSTPTATTATATKSNMTGGGEERKRHNRANSSVYSRTSYISEMSTFNSMNYSKDNGTYKPEMPKNPLLYTEDQNIKQFRSPTAPPLSENISRLSPSSTSSNINRPPSVPPSYTPYSYYANTPNNGTVTTSNTPLPYTSTYQPTTSNSQGTMGQNQQVGTYQTSSNQYGINNNTYQNSNTNNATSSLRYATTTAAAAVTPDPQGSFYNFGNQSNSEIHSCDPMIIHKNKSPIINFGFGGRMVIIFPKVQTSYTGEDYYGPGSVHIKPVSKLIYPHITQAYKEYEGPIMGQKKNKKQISELITKKINKLKEQNQPYGSYSMNDIDTDETLLLKIIQLYIENDGSLFGQTNKPEAIKKLQELLSNDNNNSLLSNSTSTSIINRPGVNSSELNRIQGCLLIGDRPGACKIAVSNKLWAHALIISSYINKETYKDVVLSFIKDELNNENDHQSNMSLKILYSLFAGSAKDSIVENVNNQMTNIHSKWKEILMMILSNRTPNDQTALISLGDILRNNGKLIASHICYMFSANSISGLYSNNTKVVLLGADHIRNPKKFYQNIDAFQMTEYLEYAYSLSNKNMNLLPHFQAYKLVYANWLSEIGLANKAVTYTESIMQILKNNNNRSPYLNATLIDGLKELNSRCTTHLSGTKFAVKDGWFSKIKKFDTFIEAFDHGLNKFIGTESENPNVPNLANISSSSSSNPTLQTASKSTVKNPNNNMNSNPNITSKQSNSYQNISDVYYNGNSSSNNNINDQSKYTPQLPSKTEGQKGSGMFSLIGNFFSKGSNSNSVNESSTNASKIENNQNKNGYYDSITKQWVSSNSNGQIDQLKKNEIVAPPPVASYDPYYNGSMSNTGSNSSTLNGSGNLAGGVIPQFGPSTTSNIASNSRRSTRAKYNDPTLNMAYSNIQGLQNNMYETNLDNNNQNSYNQAGIQPIPQIIYPATANQPTNNYWGNYGN